MAPAPVQSCSSGSPALVVVRGGEIERTIMEGQTDLFTPMLHC